MSEAGDLIERFALQPHPEGGWYRETWRAPANDGERAASTAILFLLETGQRSHWHRVDADEIWLWQGGDALRLSIASTDKAKPEHIDMGPPDRADLRLQVVIPATNWQAAEPEPAGRHGYVLVSCIVAPGFEFSGFELAPDGWSPGGESS